MPRYLVQLGTKIVEWSTIVDAPVSEGMTRDELRNYIKDRYGSEGLSRLPQRLADLDKYGSSSGESARAAVSCNRAGANESELTFEQLVTLVGGDR